MARTKQEIIGMTIEELINTYDVKVKLGAKKGSSFIFCGRIGNMDIDGLDTAICEGYKLNIKRLQGTIKANREKPKTYNDYVEEALRTLRRKVNALEKERGSENTPKKRLYEISKELEEVKEEYRPTKEKYAKWYKNILKRIKTAEETLKKVTKRLNTYTSIRERKIVDLYKSIDEEDTWIVIYDGTEVGSAWTTEEFESGVIDYGIED